MINQPYNNTRKYITDNNMLIIKSLESLFQKQESNPEFRLYLVIYHTFDCVLGLFHFIRSKK